MPYPSTISDSLTWVPHRAGIPGAYSSVTREIVQELIYASNVAVLGQTSGNLYIRQSFQVQQDVEVTLVSVKMRRTGTPTDNIVCELQTDAAGIPSGVVLGTDTLLGSTYLPVASTYYWLHFFFTASITADTTYHLVLTRSGAVHGSNYYGVRTRGTLLPAYPYGEAEQAAIAAGPWTPAVGSDICFQISTGADLDVSVMAAYDLPNTKLVALVSLDSGLNWEERDVTSLLGTIAVTAGVDIGAEGAFLQVVGNLTVNKFDPLSRAWSGQDSMNNAPNPNVSGSCPLSFDVRDTDGSYMVGMNGAPELVAAVSYRRAKQLRKTLSWVTPVIDLATGTGVLPGTAQHYDHRLSIEISNGDYLHLLTDSATSTIYCRRFDAATNLSGALVQLTMTTIDSTAPYALGNGVVYTDSGTEYVAVGYYDTAAGAVCVLRCQADSSVDTLANWTLETAISVVAETTICTPVCLGSDGGRKLWAWAARASDRKLVYSHDRGSGSWIEPVEWKPAQEYSVGAFSNRVLSDRNVLNYLNDAVVPATLNYDQLFYLTKESRVAGTTTVEFDLREDGLEFSMQVDSEPAAGASTEYAFSTRSDEGCAWDYYPGRVTVEEDASPGEVRFTACRHVRLEVTNTGADVEAGLSGIADVQPEPEEVGV